MRACVHTCVFDIFKCAFRLKVFEIFLLVLFGLLLCWIWKEVGFWILLGWGGQVSPLGCLVFSSKIWVLGFGSFGFFGSGS